MRRREAYSTTVEIDQAQYNPNTFTVFDTYEAYKVYRNQLMLLQMTGHELAMLIKEEEEDFIINNSELNITCCIMMLDMILKQIETQKHAAYLGINNPVSKEIMFILSKHLILPWIKKHKCKQQYGFLSAEGISVSGSTSNYCVFCEEHVVWYSFAKDILVHIMPKLEIELNEINFNHLIELSNQSTNQNTTHVIKSEQTEEKSSSTPKKSESKTDPELGIWVTSYGVYYFKFSQLPNHLQLLHSMLKQLYRVPDIDACYNLLVCLKMLIIHGECLEAANREQKGFLIYCLEKLLIPK
jgi:hypothetical protein